MTRRRSRWPRYELPLPKHPYRDSLIFYGFLSVSLVGVALLTGGEMGRAIVFGVGFFVIATAWSWWRFRVRIEAERRKEPA